jgi:flagellar biosynthesis chaperone FliJ
VTIRQKLGKLRKIRDIRVEQCQKAHQQAKQAIVEAQRQIEAAHKAKQDTLQEIHDHQRSLTKKGKIQKTADFERAKHMIESLQRYLPTIDQRIQNAYQHKADCEAEAEERYRALRRAQQAVDKLGVIDERFAKEEAQEQERIEEANDDPRPKPLLG